jgi:hypothetical protein
VTEVPAPAAPAPQPPIDPQWSLKGVIWGITIFLGACGAAVWWALLKDTEGGALYTAALLLSSPLLLFVGFPLRARTPLWLTCVYAALEVWKTVLLLVYSHVEAWSGWAKCLSGAAVGVACAMLIGVLVIARWAIHRDEHHDVIRTHFFATICGALYLFSHAGYDLTFALALHDRCSGLALYADDPKPARTEIYTLHFSEGSPSIDTVVELATLIDDWPAAGDGQRAAVERRLGVPNAAVTREMAFDVAEWKRLITEIDRGKPPSVWRVTIIGHASDALAPEEGKERNQWLSEARSEDTRGAIRTELKRHHPNVRVVWTLSAIANDDRFMTSDFLDGKDHKLSVEIILQRERRFELLDYAYFMTYTITTTGYGDLRPISAQAKFITCLANIFELLFIVIVINLAFGIYRA